VRYKGRGPSSTLEAWIDSEAERYGVNPHGESFGLWQIEIEQHPDVTGAQALDPFESTDWALAKISAEEVSMWSTYSAKPFYCRDVPVF